MDPAVICNRPWVTGSFSDLVPGYRSVFRSGPGLLIRFRIRSWVTNSVFRIRSRVTDLVSDPVSITGATSALTVDYRSGFGLTAEYQFGFGPGYRFARHGCLRTVRVYAKALSDSACVCAATVIQSIVAYATTDNRTLITGLAPDTDVYYLRDSTAPCAALSPQERVPPVSDWEL